MNQSTNEILRNTQVYVPNEEGAVVKPLLASSSVDGSKLATGVIRQSVEAGVDEETDPIPCTGIEAGDEVVAVIVFTTAADIATMAAHTGTFVAGTDEIVPSVEDDNTGNQYLITWIDKTP